MPDLDQINVNVTDLVPPDNFATITKNGKPGNTYSIEEDNAWRKEVEATTQSGIKGVAKPDDIVPATGFFRMLANTAQTYTNYKDVNDASIVVTYSDLNIVNGVQRNEVIIEVNNGVSEKKVFAKVGADGANGTATIPQWVAGDYSPDAMVLKDFVQYIAPNGASSTNVPGVSDKWEAIGNSKEISEITKKDSGDIYSTFILRSGSYSSDGNFSPSTNWINGLVIEFSSPEKYYLKGFGNIGTAKRVLFYNSKTTQNGTTFISSLNHTDTIDGFNIPPNTQSFIVNIEGASGAGSDIPNSQYKILFKVYYSGLVPFLKTDKILKTDRIENNQLLDIENDVLALKTKISITEGIGYPQYENGINGDTYYDKSSMRLFFKENGKWKFNPTSRVIKFKLPTDFNFNVGYDIFKQDNGKFYLNWKGLFEEKAKVKFDELTKYYVDPINGLNSNNGLSENTAFKTILHAITTAGARNLILKKGVYDTFNIFSDFTDSNVSEPLIIRCLDGRAVLTQGFVGNALTWVVDDNVYRTSRTNVANVIDLSNLDENKIPVNLAKVASISDCKAQLNSWYTDGTLVYIHSFDSRKPDINMSLYTTATIRMTAGLNCPYYYFENIDFVGNNPSSAFLLRNNLTTQYNASAYFKSCRSFGNSAGNGIAVDNLKAVIVDSCISSNHLRDAFNYHTTAAYTLGFSATRIIEIDCVGYNTGLGSTETSSNASTTHEGSTILRLNSNFNNGRGPVIADVNPNTLSCNLGVTSTNSVLAASGCFYISDASSKMWLYHCSSWSDTINTFSNIAVGGAILYVDKSTYSGNANSGNIEVI